ncbi:protein ImuB [Aeromicrobium sp. SORGH_AS981]|uniref:DNA polymerase Y family protein n=1 Tax=Aeromicrobium sp. SORGH_AS_0981 TaxID=3041802 RepID=UPI002860D6E5|nr:DNA polymerase Y family protein [Aeromicrobium sp. SORGH_AS_0981]MDR6119936.1 protein ImuB [Aeromicrobium sp. SORGH_AS_0981]
MRTLVVWCPDWPVRAALPDLPRDEPGAVLEGGQVLACNHAARVEGVRRGMRRRDAQARCPELHLADHRPDVEARSFEEVLLGVEELSPAVTPLRPGLCALPVPARFYGGEEQAAAVVAERVVSLAVWDVRLGVADTLFAAEQAARRAAPQDVHVVEPGTDAAFLAPLPVEVLESPDVVSLLRRMGLTTLAHLAALRPSDVHTRFGAHGALLHRLASGQDPRLLARREVPPELSGVLTLEPPVSRAETVAFSLRSVAERFVARLAERGVVCTALGIEVEVDGVVASTRRWAHPRWFGAVDVVDRVRWQLQGTVLPGPVGGVRLVPETVAPVGEHAPVLFGAGTRAADDERVERGIARVQGLVGHDGVLAAQVQGGRAPAARRLLTTWGEQAQPARAVGAPWPGSVPPPAPATVYAAPRPAQVVGPGDRVVGVDGRGGISCEPVRFRATGDEQWRPVASWAGPWPVDELWWDEAAARRVARFQVVGVDGTAWLMVVENGTWWTEARYD